MPISTSLYTELRFAISDYIQRCEWARLFEICGTRDDRAARTIGVIMSGYDKEHVWEFLDYVFSLPLGEARQKRDSVTTACYIIAKMGQTNIKKALTYLRHFLLGDSTIRDPVFSALSNLWVLNPRATSSILYESWILRSDGNDTLQEVSVSSCEYLVRNDAKKVESFLRKVSKLESERVAAKKARELLKEYLPPIVVKREKKRKMHRAKKKKWKEYRKKSRLKKKRK